LCDLTALCGTILEPLYRAMIALLAGIGGTDQARLDGA